MIRTEQITINGQEYKYTYSDIGVMIERDGIKYTEAIDPIDSQREYTETDVEIMSSVEQKAQAYDILIGVSQ